MLSRLAALRTDADLSELERRDLFARQILQVSTVSPLANLTNVFSTIALLVYVVPPGHGKFQLVWGTVALVVILNSVRMWMPRVMQRDRYSPKRSTSHDYWIMMAETVVLGVLLTVFAAAMLPVIDSSRKLVLISSIAGVMGAGSVALSTLRSLGLTWIWVHSIGLLIVIVPQWTVGYLVLSFQLVTYSVALSISVVYLSSTFRSRCLAEFAAAAERQTVELLLDDFEGGARDWLWEIDVDRKLSHASPRLAQVTGIPLADLRERPVEAILGRLEVQKSAVGRDAIARISGHLEGVLPFRDIAVPVRVAGADLWWSLSGNPRLSADNLLLGWRGVGSDITERYKYEQRILWLAATDALTGLPNRRSFGSELQSAVESVREGLRCMSEFSIWTTSNR
ncbi:GGDEF domain-containing protein [Rhodococcus sp. IEGM 1409]|uniref:GGDEF domain-containing protein n=1 Tax=Rhodococcus sp. IEGM 1409 TaxID=3047082 RepID=UPI0024B7D34B|nr:GGDEF domain-containing protein [Rhodococcus sp. IEGM 1409]MDI9902090.1 GGDEF domain-containing protein [Rhodococcus sp. IEGM 1409]